ncbi:hypothetical protein ACFLYP_01185, partial [Chloroflexota bacterium]
MAFSHETGSPGVLRFFRAPLAKEMSWLLPFGLISLILLLICAPFRLPLQSGWYKGAVLWGGWLMTCLVFFSIAKFFHAYYMIMLVPALAAVVGGGFSVVWDWSGKCSWIKWL